MQQEGTEPARRREASRYAEWIEAERKRKRWNQARLAKRSGLSPQVISHLMSGGAVQPTAKQVGALARAFGTDPNTVYAAVGWWAGPASGDIGVLPPDLVAVLRSLDRSGQEAVVDHARIVQRYAAELTDRARVLGSDLAAFSQPEATEEARKEIEDVDDEAPGPEPA